MQTSLELVQEDSQAGSTTGKETVFEQLMAKAGGYSNDFYLARILSSWIIGEGVMPAHLGLNTVDYHQMAARHFSGHQLLVKAEEKDVFDQQRIPEWEDVVNLLCEYRAGKDISEEWIAQIIAAACMGLDHLWQDLGLWSRKELSEILSLNFPELASRNNKDMKWKKFLYKQLCERDGTYVCRAPSCDVCADYQVCFGPED